MLNVVINFFKVNNKDSILSGVLIINFGYNTLFILGHLYLSIPPENIKNLCFSNVFRGYKKSPVV